MNEPQEINGEIIEIHPDAKYVLLLKGGTSSKEMEYILESLRAWWNGEDDPIMVLSGGVKLVRVDK